MSDASNLLLRDRYGRVATDLRISLTDRCNLRCTYCLPEENTQWMPRESLATREELARLVDIAVNYLGVREIRFTGGEPLLRPDLEGIVSDAAAVLRGVKLPVKLALTTNGIGLEKRVKALAAAGLARINISLDTLDPQRFQQIARRDRLSEVLRGIGAARDAGLDPVKVNTVLLDAQTLQQVPELIEYCLRRGIQWRGIEYMPIGAPANAQLAGEAVPDADQILQYLAQFFDMSALPATNAPARTWRVRSLARPGQQTPPVEGIIGLILAVSRPFCEDCNRTRLGADAAVRTCLFSRKTTPLLPLLRGGASDREIAQTWARAQWGKPIGHGIGEADFVPLETLMSAIGG